MTVPSARYLVVNGTSLGGGAASIPPISSFLESTAGAYTTTRTCANASLLLFWDRHVRRLAESARLLAEAPRDSPLRLARYAPPYSALRPLVEGSVRKGLALAMGTRKEGEELAVTALIASGDAGVDVYVHIGAYVPPLFGVGARLAVAGCGRDLALAKYSQWVRTRKLMEKLRPPLTTELLLSNDGDRILEGSVTNFFVVCRKPPETPLISASLEVQTAPITDGVLPGVLRHLVIEVCYELGIPVREVAPSWLEHEFWEEAFVTNSLRLLQHVEKIQVPRTWPDLQSGSWKEIQWVEKQFEEPGAVTMEIQKRVQERAIKEGYPATLLLK